jgi:CHAT domain-containing protein
MRHKRLTRCVFTALGMLPTSLWAQEGRANAARAAALVDSARHAVQASGPSNFFFAHELYLRAATIYRDLQDYRREAQSLDEAAGLLYVSSNFSDPGAALAIQRRALVAYLAAADPEGEIGALLSIASFLSELGRADSTGHYYDMALRSAEAMRDPHWIAEVWANRAAWRSDAHPDSAIVFYRHALRLYTLPEDADEIATAHYLLAIAADSMRAQHERTRSPVPDSVLAYLRMSIESYEKVRDERGGSHSAWHERSLELAAFLERQGEADSALEHWKRLIAHARVEDSWELELSALPNVVRVHREREQQDSALRYLKALVRRQRILKHEGEGETLRTIAAMYRTLGARDSAWQYYVLEARVREANLEFDDHGRALRDAESLGVSPPPEDSAVIRAEQALESIPILNLTPAEYSLQRAFALADLARAHHRERARPDLYRASAYYDSASTAIMNLLAEEASDALRIGLSERVVDLHAEWALAWLARAQEEGEARSAGYALAAVERGRGVALRLMRGFSTLSRDLWGEFDEGLDADDLYFALADALNPAVLSYLVSPDTLVIWLGNAVVARTAISRDTLVGLVRTMRTAFEDDSARSSLRRLDAGPDRGFGIGVTISAAAFEAARARLYQVLFPDTLRSLVPDSGEIVIAPSGYLNDLPFAALAGNSSSEPLGLRYAIRYTPTLQILGDSVSEAGQSLPTMPDKFYAEGPLLEGVPLARKKVMDDSARLVRRDWLRRALVIGNPEMPEVMAPTGEQIALPRLAGAAAEGESVARLLGTRLLTDTAASETAVRARMVGATVVHLATHGFAYSDPVETGRTFVALAADQRNDGLLTVDDVLRNPEFSIAADLVVLSACQTGLGAPTAAEGTLGLQRAFLARGARTVLVSLWNVSDDATRLLMERFYAHWLREENAPDKAEALRLAQRDVRATAGFEHPRYWAAFQLVGAR